VLDLDITDAHHHLWDLNNHYPWLQESAGRLQVHGDDRAIRRDYLLSDFLADIGGLPVRRSVHVDAGAADPLAEVAWLQAIADNHGYPHGIVARAVLDDPGIDRLLEQLAGYRNVRGVRHIVNWHEDPALTFTTQPDLLTSPAWRRGFALLERFGLSFDLQLYPHQFPEATELAMDFPGVQVVLNHTGMPLGRDKEALEQWRRGMAELSKAPNVAVKISGLGMTDHHWTVESVRPYVLGAIELFGPERSMFASNFPVDKLYSSYSTLYSAFDELTSSFSRPEREQLFSKSAERIYRLS
jgi:predicted TIM-barrel fold metal-dependent hydrolase